MIVKGLILPGARAAPAPSNAAARVRAPLRLVANRPIVCHVLDELRRVGITEVVIAVPAQESAELRGCIEVDRSAGLAVEYLSYEDGEFERALSAAAQLVGDAACVVHAADGLLAQALTPLVGLLREDAPDLVALVHQSPADAASIGLATRRLLRIVGESREDGDLDLAGVCLLGPGALRRASGARWWQDQELDLVAIAEEIVGGGGRLWVERVRGWRRGSGGTDDLLELNRIALDSSSLSRGLVGGDGHRDTGAIDGGAAGADLVGAGNRIEGSVEIHPTACVQSSVIIGPAIVGPGALVLESYIGPYTSIGADARIEGAEVERSIILQGASITHIGGRLVGSVVGRDARIFRDFSLPRALRMTVGDGNEVALC